MKIKPIKFLRNIKRIILAPLMSVKAKRHLLVGPASLWKMKQDFQIKFLKENGLLPIHKFIDIGCGTLRGGIPLINYLNTANYYGIDVREEALNEGKKGLEEEDLITRNPNLILFEDFRLLELGVKFDVMFAFSVLFHLEDSIAKSCFEFIALHISDDGVFYANVNDKTQSEGKWLEFPVVYRGVEFYNELAKDNNLTMQIISTLKELGHISNDDRGDLQVMLEFRKNC